MAKALQYPSVEHLIECNLLALNLFKVKRADKPAVLSQAKITEILEECRALEGDVYDKAVYLLKGIIQKHPFASGNRRTALLAAKEFILDNSKRFDISDDPEHARVLQGIRENYYTDAEIREWIHHGKIRPFKR